MTARERARSALIAGVGGSLLTGVMRSVRSELIAGQEVESEILEAGVPAVYVLWHGRLLPCAFRYRNHGFATLISRNRDGDHISRVVEGWGFEIIRGSSSRGGAVALREIVRVLKGGNSVALTPDGPRGPRQKMKLGPLQAAQAAGVPIIPVSAGAVRAGYFGRWDRFLVPVPFTWVPTAFGEPRLIPPEANEEELVIEAERIEVRLNQLTEMVDEAARARR